MSDKVRLRYERCGTVHTWAAITRDRSFGVHIWCDTQNLRPVGGVEIHRKPQDGESADHDICHLLLGPCIHDGSSLQFHQNYEAAALDAIRENVPEYMLTCALNELIERMPR